MNRTALHKAIDELLDEHGFEQDLTQKWGSFLLEVKFENSRIVLKVKERETVKEVR